MEARARLSQLEQVGMIYPQVALALFHLCGGFCKLVHVAGSHHHHFHQWLSVVLMILMTSVGLSVSARVLTPPKLPLPRNKLSSALEETACFGEEGKRGQSRQ